jgi:CheY-like chemotaxis protein
MIMPRPLRLLHLEDSPRDAEIVRHRLDVAGLSCDILLASGKDSFEAALAGEPFDLIISDYNLPGYDGITALKQAQSTQPDVRLIDEIQLQRLRVFKATIRTVQDIVNNLLNTFQFVRLETEGQLPAEMLTLVDRMIEEAAVKLRTLGDLETVKEKEMTIGLGIDYPGSES